MDPPRLWRQHVGTFSIGVTLVLSVFSGQALPADRPTTPRERSETQSGPPNILIILADDLGFSDLGCYGGEIKTPNLDDLADQGLRFTQFYNTGRCWPTRAALLTGFYAQQVRRDKVPDVRSGGNGQRPRWAQLIPERLKDSGYRCYHSGKWHLDGMPLATGFNRSYYLQDQGRFFHPQVHYEDDVKLPPAEPGRGFYATKAIADHAIRFLTDHREQTPKQPFFCYLAFTAPHFPLQALPNDIRRYRSAYQAGWDAVRHDRWSRLQHFKIVTGQLSAVERDVGPPYDFPDALRELGPGELNRPLAWSSLTDEQREFQSAKMAIHAAMVDRMDQEIGRVFDQLRRQEVWNNTLIFFLSDNGASAEIMIRDDGHDPRAAPGSADSYLCLGPGWSTVCNTPLRRHKTWVHEGGIATPLIVHWPCGFAARGELRHQPGHVIDLVPTILQIVQADNPTRPDDRNGPHFPGASLWPALIRDDARQTERELWWLHEGNRAIRVGPWKLVAARAEPWQLFNLADDRTESKDLAPQYAEKVTLLEDLWVRRFDEFCQLAKTSASVVPGDHDGRSPQGSLAAPNDGLTE